MGREMHHPLLYCIRNGTLVLENIVECLETYNLINDLRKGLLLHRDSSPLIVHYSLN